MLADPSAEAPRPRWQPKHMPRLSYRNAALEFPTTVVTQQTSSISDSSHSSAETILPSSAVAGPRSPVGGARPRSPGKHPVDRSSTVTSTRPSVHGSTISTMQPTKKRGSLFGGLFVKEPSSAALEHLSQKLISEHGELSARAIPGVSMTKMPESVPKVNSKWDGVPKPRDGREREPRALKTPSSGSSVRSRSAEPLDHDQTASRLTQPHRRLSNSSSSHARAKTSSQRRSRQVASDTSVVDSGLPSPASAKAPQKTTRPRSKRPQSLRTPSGNSLPEITSFFPNQAPSTPIVPARFRVEDGQATMRARAYPTNAVTSQQCSSKPVSLNDDSGDHASSPDATPSEASPVTPLSTYGPGEDVGQELNPVDDRIFTTVLRSRPDEVLLLSSGPKVLGPPRRAKRRTRPPAEAFLAGEARPLEISEDKVHQDLEKRPDTSRARLGLRASMIIDTDKAPWEVQVTGMDGNVSPDQSTSPQVPSSPKFPINPKFLPKSLGKFSKVEK